MENKSLVPNGAIFVYPIYSSLSRLKGLDEFNGDFINLDDNRERILEFYIQNFYKSCNYCRDFSKPNKKF
ncbi:hypothetical protein FPD38_04745 [Campylobacter volucris]|uniref:Uncharacterized protein n=1 Tax=Campylobacter volucris TaxID=1031542 RepID=A0A5C7E0Z1_9BACT|nr:hypothetical protein [Campylobacter volucris]TXE88146.1 hypothetical protein FPD38_04745 [Campylobacter volucris]